jgi:D-arabinose 5-phosphate isomerase GutQ
LILEIDDILKTAYKVIDLESQGVASLAGQLDSSFVRAAQMLLECSGHVLVTGSGTSNPVAARLAHLLSCCGTPALFIHPGDSQHGLSGAVTSQDIVIAISKGGETTEINHLSRITKKRGARLIAITEKPSSTLGKLSDLVLKAVAPDGIDPYGMIATGSSLINAALGDALCVVMLHLRGYSKEKFGETHPGGAVGLQIQEKQT